MQKRERKEVEDEFEMCGVGMERVSEPEREGGGGHEGKMNYEL